jgi:hypothetical protein
MRSQSHCGWVLGDHAESAFGVPLEIHYDDGSLKVVADRPGQKYE